ncbi:MAG: tetratricopeptide repeat protein [Bacteroidota bacterium]
MKKGIMLISHLLFCLLLLGAEEQDQQFKKANDAYAAKQYTEAIQAYEAILQEGWYSVELYYNLGNSYYKTQQIGRAILNYERGLYLAPSDEDLRHNLLLVENELVDDFSLIPTFFLSRWWDQAVRMASTSTWAFSGLLLLWLGIGGLVLWILGQDRTQKKRGFFIGIALLLLSVLPFALAIGKASLDQDSRIAILLEKEFALRSAPDQESSEILLLHEGLKLSILDEIGAWYKVRLSNGEEGWLPKTAIERV